MISSSVKPCDSAGALMAIAKVAAAVDKLRVSFLMMFPLLLVGTKLHFLFFSKTTFLAWKIDRDIITKKSLR
jgi:hypothetical protein